MIDFSRWIKYVAKDTEDDNHLRHIFYRLTDFDIKDAQQKLNYRIPRELEIFYKQIGYGFLCCDDNEFIDRIMDPESIVQLLNKKATDEYLLIDYKKMLPFFEIGDGSYITINIKTSEIFYFDQIIASSLSDFLDKMDEKANYYIRSNDM